MRLTRVLWRTVANVVDVGLIVAALMVSYIAVIVSYPVADAMANALVEYIDSLSFSKMIYAFFSSLGVLGVLALFVYLIASLFLGSLVISWVWKKRTKTSFNVFKRALERIPHLFVASFLVSFFPLLFFLLYLLYQPYPMYATLSFVLFVLSVFLWIPLSFPLLATSVVENIRGRHIVSEGLLAGKSYYLKILVLLLILSLLITAVYYIVLSVLPPSPLASAILMAVTAVLVYGASAEVYHQFKRGGE